MSFRHSFEIGHKTVGAACLIVGEIGPNHDGDPAKALALIGACAKAGCDAVKFQYRIADEEIFDHSTKSYYYDETRYNFIKRVQELPHLVHAQLREYAKRLGLCYLCSVFSEESVRQVASLDPDGFKIPSGEVGNPWLLELVGALGKPVIASSGMSPIGEIDAMMATLGKVATEVVLLHCISEYPTPLEDMHLRMIPVLRERYGCPVGLSDHSRNIPEIAASVLLGAAMIEVHVTFDRIAPGPDHHISLLPDELTSLVARVRALESALGKPHKVLGAHADSMRQSFTNSIVTRRAVAAGEILSRDNLTLMKPGTGLSPSELPHILGRKAAHNLPALTAIKRADVA
jgi:sialic acid synthase SpsE